MKARTLAAILIISLLSKNLWEYTYQNLYYHGEIVCWLLAFLLFFRLSGSDYWMNRVSLIGVYWCISDLLDWLLFDPYTTGWNEWIFAVAIIILVFRKSRRSWQKQQKKRGNWS